MKYIITEAQYRLLMEQDEILNIPFHVFNNDWNLLQKFLDRRGNPPYKISGNLDLSGTEVKSLGNLMSVGGWLNLIGAPIESIGNLTSVGDNLYLFRSKIESLGNLTSVGGNLDLRNTPISETHSEKDIRNKVEVGGEIYL
jgi:hypothetical protein